jgi:hypothetical protein
MEATMSKSPSVQYVIRAQMSMPTMSGKVVSRTVEKITIPFTPENETKINKILEQLKVLAGPTIQK